MKNSKRASWKTRAFSLAMILPLFIFLMMPAGIGRAEAAVNAAAAVKAMQVGWNLGNTLDAYGTNVNAHEPLQQKRDKYQIMAAYSTKSYSGWDASPTPYISSNGAEFVLNWDITKLNSAINQPTGFFAFQLINQEISSTGTNTLDFTVTKAQFTKKDGSVVTLGDMVGTYSQSLTNKVTPYVKGDLTKHSQLKTTADVLGGRLTIGIKIDKYPLPLNPKDSKEAYYETLWGNPVTTKKMIDEIKKAGFGAVRIPVTYSNHMDSSGKIDPAWLARVKQVVQYAVDNDMYCIINVHHDTGEKGWLKADLAQMDTTVTKYKYMWSQIAAYMKDYDHKVLFEGYNELLNTSNKWSWADGDSYKAANLLNQAFVDTVRGAGGNNAQRFLVVNTYAASAEEKEIKAFVMPTDPASNRLIAQVHYYGTSQSGITAVVERLNKHFVSKGIPVIIGESGMSLKSAETERVNYARFLASSAKKYNIAVFWWDDGNYANKAGAKSNYALYDRVAMKWYHSAIAQALVNASK